MIRMHYDKAIYTELVGSAYAAWRNLETVSRRKLLFITGGLLFALEGHSFVLDRKSILDNARQI